MDKTVLKHKVNSTNFTLEQLNSWIDTLPVNHKFETPTQFKPGDIIYSKLINHPCILLKHLHNDQFLATGLTSNPCCKQILCPCQSRFFPDSFITKSLFTVTADQNAKIKAVYDNKSHLDTIYSSLLNVMVI